MAENDQVTDDFMRDALDQFAESDDDTGGNRQNYEDDTRFARLGDQWPTDVYRQRIDEGRPALTINKLPPLIRSVVNESRQAKPSIQVGPVDNGADEDTAEVISGLIKSIERGSNAEVAYDTAIDNAVTGGFGFFRLGIDYAHDDSFDLKCTIDRIPNALSVHWDTSSTRYDASDWEYGFISEMMNKKRYEKLYPDASLVEFNGDSRDDASELWRSDESIRIAEYFKRTEHAREIVRLAIPNPQTGQTDIQVVRVDDLPEMATAAFEAGGMDPTGGSDEELVKAFIQMSGIQEQARREVTYNKVTRHVINGVEVLEEEHWPGSTIPICPVWGDEVFVDGYRTFKSMIRDAKDSQQMVNFWQSATTELVALAPKSPWVGPKGFVPKGHEDAWKHANTRSRATLEYNPSAGPPPTRQPFAGVPAGALQETISASENIQAITGVYPSAIGAQSNETSGKAIMARERQGDVSNFHFTDNLSRAIQYGGRCLVEIIPSVYSAKETIRILGEDEAEKVIKLTQEAGGTQTKGVSGQDRLYNLSVGKYDVTVKSGPNFATQREETRETLIEIMRQVPDAAPFIGDVLLDHMDFVGADKVAKRLKHLLPQAVQDAESEEVTGSDNPEAAQAQQELKATKMQMQQMQEQVMAEIQKIQQENEQLKASKDSEIFKAQSEADIKSRELALKEQEPPKPTAIEQHALDMEAQREKQDFDAEQNRLDRQTDLAKTIISKAEAGDSEEDMDNAMSQALLDAAKLMGAERVAVYDDDGNLTGSRIAAE